MPNDTGSPNAASPNPGDPGNGGGGIANMFGLSYFAAIIKATDKPERLAALSVLVMGVVGFGLLKGTSAAISLAGYCVLVIGVVGSEFLILRSAAARVQAQAPPAPPPGADHTGINSPEQPPPWEPVQNFVGWVISNTPGVIQTGFDAVAGGLAAATSAVMPQNRQADESTVIDLPKSIENNAPLCASGEVTHVCEEPLMKHQGHGSAKKNP